MNLGGLLGRPPQTPWSVGVAQLWASSRTLICAR